METQKTRSGLDASGEKTRPYHFGEFDILAVSMQAATNSWDKFLFTVANWLLPVENRPDLIATFQPVPSNPNDAWTDDFETAAKWLRSDIQKRIWERVV